MMVRSRDAYVTILHFRAVIDGVHTSRRTLDLDASSFLSFLSFLSFPTLIQLVPTQTRRARLPKHPKKQTRGRQLLLDSPYSTRTRVVVFDAFGGTRRHTGFEPNPSIISLFEDTNSKPCSVFYVHFSSRDWSILRFYPPSVRGAARLVSSRRRSTRNGTNERARVEREGACMRYIARAFCSAYTRTRRREVA